jgi:hypothetical protein
MSRRTTSNQVMTVTELASQVGRCIGTVSRWTRRDDWPFARRGPWGAVTVERIKTWAADTLAPNPADEELLAMMRATPELEKILEDELRAME